MIDAHCHLNFPEFDKDLDETVKRATDKGVETIINVGTSIEHSEQVVKLAGEYENLYAIVGVHPHDADKLSYGWLERLEQLAKMPKVLAIGEIGLDYFGHETGRIVEHKIQKEVFIKQVELALKLRLPLQIHSRQSAKDIIEILKGYGHDLSNQPGMFHCFAGDIDYLKSVLNLGFYVGFDGNITYKGLAPGENTVLKDLVEYAPLGKILTETDAPFLTPMPYRGSRNEPSYVIIVAETIAKIKGVSFDKVNKITTENAKKLFILNT